MKFDKFKKKYKLEDNGQGKGKYVLRVVGKLDKELKNTPAVKAAQTRFEQLKASGKALSSESAQTSALLSAFAIENFQRKAKAKKLKEQRKRRSPDYWIKRSKRRRFQPASRGKRSRSSRSDKIQYHEFMFPNIMF